VIGVFLGLMAALFQSLSYLCTKAFIRSSHRTTLDLLALGHIVMGVFAVVLLPFVWPASMPPLIRYALPTMGAALFYMTGQAFLFIALFRVDASRISPLLSMKVFLLALLTLALGRGSLSLVQWGAVAMSMGAAWVLAGSGERIAWGSFGWVFLACSCYCGSDLSIRILVERLDHLDYTHAILLSTSLTYIVCGLAGCALLPFLRRPTMDMWLKATPFAVTWFVAMIFLFACFGLIDVVYGNIVQSTRGLISILFGAALAARGYERLEQKVDTGVLVRRIGAALLMTGAIVLFKLVG